MTGEADGPTGETEDAILEVESMSRKSWVCWGVAGERVVITVTFDLGDF